MIESYKIVLGVVFALSIVANGFLLWYVRRVLFKLLFVLDNLEDLATAVSNYSNHLESVYGLETFYGDETLKSLLKHTVHIISVLEQYETSELIIEGRVEAEAEDDESENEN